MLKFLKAWNEHMKVGPAAAAVILIAFVYMMVSWDMPEVDFWEFTRMPVIEMEAIHVFMIVIAANLLTSGWPKKKKDK